METYFVSYGRLSRGPYFGQLLVFAVIEFLMATVCVRIPGAVGTLLAVASMGLYVYVTAMATVKRLHDIGRPGSHYFLLLIPFYNLYLQCCLLFKKGV